MSKSDSIWVNLEASLLEQISKHGTSWSKIQCELPGVTVASMRGRWARIKSVQKGKQLCRICKRPRRGHLYSTCRNPLIVYDQPVSTHDQKQTEYDLFDLHLPDFDVESLSNENNDGVSSSTDDSVSLTATEVLNDLETLDELSYSSLLQLILENSKAIDQLQDQTEQLSQEIAALKNTDKTVTQVDAAMTTKVKRKTKTSNQTELLLKCYEEDIHPSMTTRQTLASDLNLSLQQVNDWFTNRRKRSK